MNNKFKKFLRSAGCLLLALLMLLSCVACKGNKQNEGETTEAPTEEGTLPPVVGGDDTPPYSALKYLDLEGKPILRAAYVGRKKTTPLFTNLTGTNGAPEAVVGATWTESEMTVYVNYDAATSVKIKLNGLEKDADMGDGSASAVFTHAETGLHLADLGQYVALSVVVANDTANAATFDGYLELRDYSTEAYFDGTDYKAGFKSATVKTGTVMLDGKKPDAGATDKDGAIVIYDRFSDNNYGAVTNKVQMKPIDKVALGGSPLLTEFDLNIKAMPVMNWEWTDQLRSYGLSVLISESTSKGKTFMLTFVNTPAGIAVFYNGTSAETSTAVFYTGKKVGDDMRVGLLWRNGDMELYIDGYKKGVFEEAAQQRDGNGDHTISFIWQRTEQAPASAADNFEATLDNLTVASYNDYSVIETLAAASVLGENRRLEGENVYLASGDLTFVSKLTNEKYGIDTYLYWESSDTTVIGSDGKLYKPQTGGGILVMLTARVASGDYVVAEKEFQIFVQSANPTTNVLWKKSDTDPYSGEATTADNVYIVDAAQNSIVYDMGSKQKINRAVLHSMNEKNRITGNFVALYASDDNKTYTMVPGFCMLHSGTDIHFFNFDVEARYLKIHFSYTTSPEYDIAVYNSLQRAMSAYYSESALLDGNASFAGSTTVTVVNDTDKPVYDKIVKYTLEQLNIAGTSLKADLSDIRFRVAGKECPHYYANGTFYVRVPEIAANSSATVTVYYGNTSAEDISNAVTTLEIEYGTKMVITRLQPPYPDWRYTVGVMPNGDLLRIGPAGERRGGGIAYERSKDGGHSWAPTVETGIKSTSGEKFYMQEGGGFIVDFENNTVFFICDGADEENNFKNKKTWIMKSTDNGETWTWTEAMSRAAYGKTYSDGIKLSTYDGDGPNVDYVFTTMQTEPETGVPDWENHKWNSGCGSVYSTDGGKTWTPSENYITFGFPYPEEYWGTHEAGVTEETVWEQEDGTLILYARHQSVYLDENGNVIQKDIPHFVVAYSYDHGVTWDQDSVRTSEIFTSQTQPIIEGYLGTPLLVWGGNNSHGFRSYDRFPLNVAYSVDDAENFVGILDISAQTYLANRVQYRPTLDKMTYGVTNPDIAIFEYGGATHAYLVIQNQFILVENFDNYLYKTKGAYDSFEIGSTEAEGWVTVSGTEQDPGNTFVPGDIPFITTKGATAGDYAMGMGSQTYVSRSIPYVEKGEIFFDLYYSSFGNGTTVNFQSAYNYDDPSVSSPMRIALNSAGEVCYYKADGTMVKTALKAKEGDNSFTLSFDLPAKTATLTVNGQSVEIDVDENDGAYLCFVNIVNGVKTSNALDNFGVVDLD